jgi:hypothetical protein
MSKWRVLESLTMVQALQIPPCDLDIHIDALMSLCVTVQPFAGTVRWLSTLN